MLGGVAGGEVEADTGGQFADTGADLEQAQAEGVELERRVVLGAQPATEGVEQAGGGGVREEAELVGPEADAIGASERLV